ncbi:MAG: sodium/proline symporter [Planctomycetes bacterium]|nr:sodium/proline symporter [Planctomycetota bacterium]MCP4770357.1 sodium/proline symporter [Planctomycetota bacterium]MCP4861962.1 sodium/proline symporter [Planctomycetota bacterium]
MKLLAVALYATILLVIGYLASKRVKSIRDYFVSGKNLGFFNVAFSARATGESAWLLLGLTGMGYAVGVQAFWVVLGEVLGVCGAWMLMARRFKRLTDRYDSVTVPDYLESRLRDSGHTLRLIAAFALMVFVPIYAGAQVFATGTAFHAFLGWNHFVGAAVGFGVVMLYITKGGFTAVVWSDVFQGSLMVIGLVALPIVAFNFAGGWPTIAATLESIDPHLLSWHGPGEDGPSSGSWNTSAIVTIFGMAAIGIGFMGSPQVFVRYISMKNEKQILPGTITAGIWTVLADSGAVLVGLIGRAIFSPESLSGNFDNILPVMAQDLLPAFFAGLFIAMVLSAIMSTIDSLLVVASSAGVRDYWQKSRHPEMSDERLLGLTRKVTITLSLVSFMIGIGIMLVDKENGVFWTIIFGWSGIAATFCPTVILSLFWSKLTALGAKSAMVAGFLAIPLFKWAIPPMLDAAGHEDWSGYLASLDVLLPSFVVGFLVAIVVSLVDKKGQARMEGMAKELRS